MKTFKFEFVKLSLIWRCTNGPRREKDKFDLNFPAGRPQGKINQIIFLLFIAAGSGDWSILELSNRAAAGERTMKSFLLFLELVGYGAGTAQWLRQEEKTKKKWLNEWVSPQRKRVKSTNQPLIQLEWRRMKFFGMEIEWAGWFGWLNGAPRRFTPRQVNQSLQSTHQTNWCVDGGWLSWNVLSFFL